MEIRSLELHNFRNYERASLRFEEKLNFFVGENASGKTSLLEALAYVSLGRSFRGVNDADLVREGERHFFIRCELRNRDDSLTRFEIGVEAGRKKIKRDGVVLKRTSQMIGSLVCVVFTPEDLALVQNGHQERRAYIDFVLGSVDGEYLESLLQFNRALRQRNELLRRIQENKARLDDLLPWDDIFIKHAVTVQRKRMQFLSVFEPVVIRSVERISGLKDRITLKMETSLDEYGDREGLGVQGGLGASETQGIEVQALRGEQNLRERMKQRRYDEVRAGHSLIGPHRDKLYFLESSGEEIGKRFSQGQKRTLALSLKVAQFYYLKEHIGRPPVLLVDDVLQELDQHRRQAFLEVLDDCGQAFFTTPDFSSDEASFKSFSSSRVFVVKNGAVSEKA